MNSPVSSPWSLHPQLARDTAPLGELPLSRLLVMDDVTYPWLVLVPRRPGAVELFDLDETEQVELMYEVVRVGHALKAVASCDKLNIAAIGNIVPQLHVHIVARRRDDPAWPQPVWGRAPAVRYDKSALDRFADALRARLAPT